MPGDHSRIVGQGEQLRLNTGNELGVIATEEIRAAHGAGEQHITRETQSVANKGHVTGRVPWHVPHLEAPGSERHDLAMGECMIRRVEWRHRREAEVPTLVSKAIVPRSVGRVEPDRCTSGIANGIDTPDVIHVAMREPDRGDREFAMPDRRKDAAVLLTGVNHDGLLGGVVNEQHGVLAERSIRHHHNLQPLGGGDHSWCASQRSASMAAMQPLPADVTA